MYPAAQDHHYCIEKPVTSVNVIEGDELFVTYDAIEDVVVENQED